MQTRCVAVAGGRAVTLRQYVAAVKMAKAQPETMFRSGLSTDYPVSGAEVVDQFREGMVDRLNQAVPRVERGLNGGPVLVPVEKPARVHRGQAQWRRRLKGRTHGFEDGGGGVDRVTICEHCEKRHGVGAGEASYLGVEFGDRPSGGWRFIRPQDCEHPEHGGAA
ncbi:MAG: hypothetical protein OXG35_32455 [Acidobacteria bacterium]|nr:hypothetical protein [Acidobacteriota bacterium]